MPVWALLFLNIWINCLYHLTTHLPYEGTLPSATVHTCLTQSTPFYHNTYLTLLPTYAYPPTVVVAYPIQESTKATPDASPHTNTTNMTSTNDTILITPSLDTDPTANYVLWEASAYGFSRDHVQLTLEPYKGLALICDDETWQSLTRSRLPNAADPVHPLIRDRRVYPHPRNMPAIHATLEMAAERRPPSGDRAAG